MVVRRGEKGEGKEGRLKGEGKRGRKNQGARANGRENFFCSAVP